MDNINTLFYTGQQNPYGQNQFSSKVETFHNNCPIHGQTIIRQQYSGY